MAPFFHKYSMVTDEIKLIRTKKEGDELLKVQENYPNSIIDVNSQKEKNVYIGIERITDNYNLGVDENKVTNTVGGMSSGINASELKGKSISEILDIILFASDNNMTLKGVQVVDKIENLTDDTLVDIYQGMVVSVVEDKSLYILLTNSDNLDREWKKVGSDVDIEELKVSTKKLSAPIVVAGLSEGIGNITNGMEFGTDKTIEDILRELLCKEIYPSVYLSTTNPTISFDGISIDNTNNNYKSVMEVGSVLNLGSVSLGLANISKPSRVGRGFTWGYSVDNDNKKDNGNNNPPVKDGVSSLVGKYSLTETYTPSNIGIVRTVESSENYENVKFDAGSVKIALGSNKITFSASSPSGSYTHPEYPEYFVVSNLGNTNENKKLEKSDEVNKTITQITDNSKSIEVTGVYPVYVNIDSGSLVEDTKEMELTDSNTIVFENAPSEVASKIHFTFDYPATHDVVSFMIMDVSRNFVDYASPYDKVYETITKVINGEIVSYKRLKTTGNFIGVSTYKIILSKGLDE